MQSSAEDHTWLTINYADETEMFNLLVITLSEPNFVAVYENNLRGRFKCVQRWKYGVIYDLFSLTIFIESA